MRQPTFAASGFEISHKQTKRERFLAEMEKVVPWEVLCALIEPHYPNRRARAPADWG
jgi:transposase, IS5 family